jgi:hypothetical protein
MAPGGLSGLVLQDAPLLLQISEEPCILAQDDFLSPQECQVSGIEGGGGLWLQKAASIKEPSIVFLWGILHLCLAYLLAHETFNKPTLANLCAL